MSSVRLSTVPRPHGHRDPLLEPKLVRVADFVLF